MEALLVSTFVVALGEIGDKTQLLALLLAARFRRPLPIVLGILLATLANHSIAGLVGEWVRTALSPDILRWILGGSFIAIGLWALKPDKFDGEPSAMGRYGIFLVTLSTFFIAEIGDKTQLATVVLAARFDSLVAVVAGTTLGMLIADVPAVLLGDRAAPKIPFKLVRGIAAALFVALGVGALLSVQLG
ncbi:MAG TPA: TMEM165/GDT1 family protein [Burkholderiales bacterium]|nr:TMEM165/GDT1 family protein [Burkholderiales bacterium]